MTPQRYRIKGHAVTLEPTGRDGRQRMYRARCECGWVDRERAGKHTARDFHVAHLSDVPTDAPVREANAVRIAPPPSRRWPTVGEVWTLASSGYAYSIDAVDPPHYRQSDAGLLLRSVIDPRVTTAITMLSFLRRYTFASAPIAVATNAATCSGATC